MQSSRLVPCAEGRLRIAPQGFTMYLVLLTFAFSCYTHTYIPGQPIENGCIRHKVRLTNPSGRRFHALRAACCASSGGYFCFGLYPGMHFRFYTYHIHLADQLSTDASAIAYISPTIFSSDGVRGGENGCLLHSHSFSTTTLEFLIFM